MTGFEQHPHHIARKRFGQHFLHDADIIKQIVSAINIQPDDHVIEIGPGLGALTQAVLPFVKQLEVVEIDRDIIPKLVKLNHGSSKLFVHQADALQFDFTSLVKDTRPMRVIGNLPYNISTPLIFHLLTQTAVIKDMHFMLQKEVVERMAARVGTSSYGRLSIMVQYHCQVEQLFNVGKEAFSPPPKVESAIVRLVPYHRPPFPAKDYQVFENVVRLAFSHRRKAIRNSVKSLLDVTQLEQLGIDPSLRPEQLNIETYVNMSNYLAND